MNDVYTAERSVQFGEMSLDKRYEFIKKVGHDEFYRAIGYLSTWNPSYPTVRIMLDTWNGTDAPEILASYYSEDNLRQYTIAAVYNPSTKQFGFHS